ncbi:MAG: putative MATE family efflux protein [Halobacteriales archaeon]|jgi:putative MATE family efflux protein
MFDLSSDEITEDSLSRVLVVLAAPLVVQNLVQVAQMVVDTFWVGRLGATAVGAVGLTYPVVALLMALGVLGPTIGTQVIVSQRAGGDDVSGARRIAIHGIVLGVGFGTIIALVTLLAPGRIVRLLNAGPAVAPLATTYLATYVLSFPFVGLSDTIEGGFVGWGDSRAALYLNVIAVVVNIGLDPFLIFGIGPFPALGIKGAALATVIGYGTGAVFATAMVLGFRDTFTLTRDAVDFSLEEFYNLLDVGLPTTGQRLAQDVVRVVIVGVVATAGGAAGLAAYMIGARVASVSFIPASGLQQAATSVVGQNLGADKPGRARRTTWVGVTIAAGVLTVIGAVQWLIPVPLTKLFVPDVGPETLDLTVQYLKILALGYWAIGAAYLVRGGFNGARRTRTSMVMSILQYWGVRLPIAAGGVFLLNYGVIAAFWAVTLSNIAAAVGGGLYYWYTTEQGMLQRAAREATSDAAAD